MLKMVSWVIVHRFWLRVLWAGVDAHCSSWNSTSRGCDTVGVDTLGDGVTFRDGITLGDGITLRDGASS